MPTKALIWFKRDLRVTDHAPLLAASRCDAALGVYVVEPEWLASPEFDPRHLAFAQACLAPLEARLAERGLALHRLHVPMLVALAKLHAETGFTHLFSHEETGSGWTYARDKAVAHWCRAKGVTWQQWPQTGVVRPLKDRRGWAGRWASFMNTAQVLSATPSAPFAFDVAGESPARHLARAAGEAAAHAALNDFLAHRGAGYRRNLSSPLTAEQGCSRLSAHLAFGTLSMRQVHQATERQIKAYAEQGSPEAKRMAYDLRGFASRLRWHCHFMQKLEDEPAIEFRNFARAYDGLRDETDTPVGNDAIKLAAWQAGQTGYPMVDACMRSLNATGWLNFRMRALLVSFAAYHLWLHWRAPGLHLARQFLDFEPGIHWSQMQMQSGTTGINTLRIYSPTKQALDHDPTGEFIARWCPELAPLRERLLVEGQVHRLFEPWRLAEAELAAAGVTLGGDGPASYPRPIVDDKPAVRHAKERLYALRGTAGAKVEAKRVQERHGSRKSGLLQSGQGRRMGKPGQPVRSGSRKPDADQHAQQYAHPAEGEQQAQLF